MIIIRRKAYLLVIWWLTLLRCSSSRSSSSSGLYDINKVTIPSYKDHNARNHHIKSDFTSKRRLLNDKPSIIAAKAVDIHPIAPEAHMPSYYKIFSVKPIEMSKFVSLSMMMFWIIYVFTMTRDTKDVLIVTNCGAEAIAFLKVYGVIPAAMGFMIIYSKLSNQLPMHQLFYAILAPFFIFYALFAFVLYPYRHHLHPMSIVVPQGGMSYVVNLLRYWTFSLYYIVSELWGSAGVPLLFWSCANDVIKVEEASRLYPLISMIGNLGPIFSGLTMSYISNYIKTFTHDDDVVFELSMKVLTIAMLIAGGFISIAHHITRAIQARDHHDSSLSLSSPSSSSSLSSSSPLSSSSSHIKPKPTFFQSLHLLSHDPYLRNIAIMVISYGLTMELTEIIWKATVKKAFPIRSDYLAFNGRCSALVGVSSFIMMIIGVNIVKISGWYAGAMMTPLMMAVSALPFFASLTYGGINNHHISSSSSLLVAVYVGLVQNVLSKGTKYSIFDPTKEMTYIPLDKDSKTKGKAAIDVLGARLGKSGGAFAQQLLVMIFGNIITGAPVLAALFYMVIFAWIGAVSNLTPMFKEKIATSSLINKKNQ